MALPEAQQNRLSNYTRDAMVKHVFGLATYTPVATVYLGLVYDIINDDDVVIGDVTEPETGASYARQAITFGAASGRTVTQSGVINFPQLTADYSAAVTSWIVTDSATVGAGNILAYGNFNGSFAWVTDETPSIPDGEIWIKIGDTKAEIGDYLGNAMLNFVFRNVSYTAPASIYVGLSTDAIANSDTGSTVSEPGGSAYARQAGSWQEDDSLGEGVDNSAAITFPVSSGTGETIKAIFLADALTGGNLLYFDNWPTSDQKTLYQYVSPQFDAGNLKIVHYTG